MPEGSGNIACMVGEREGGIYVLILRLPRPVSLSVGRLGSFEFPAGWYAYVGSAYGAGGLRARIAYHLRPPVHRHWHLDYLRAEAYPVEVWYKLGGHKTEECIWARATMGLPTASVPVPGFGSSDCRCRAHLFHFTELPNLASLACSLSTSLSRVALWMESSNF